MTDLQKVKKALEIAAKHKYGDGDYTALFEGALAKLTAYIERLESDELVEEVTYAICDYFRKEAPKGLQLGTLGYDMKLVAKAAISVIKHLETPPKE